jgi:hypothetical protein
MADRQLHRKFAPDIVKLPVLTATVIEVGDLCQHLTGNVQPASSEAWNVTVAATRDDFKSTFVGVAMQASAAGETAEIAIATRGVFEFDCVAATFDYGALVGPADELAAGVALDDQIVESAVIAGAIGQVVRTYAVNTTRVLVRIFTFGAHDAP